jgi:hypothetical protein
VFEDGVKTRTLRGDNITNEFKAIIETYVARTYPRKARRPEPAPIRTTKGIMSKTLQAVRGMNDILPDDAEVWEQFEDIVRDWLHSYGYRPIRMPIVEPTPLFKRAIGEVTDIVEKEMYSFEDALNGEHLTLRPEGTASCVRAAIQHNLLFGNPRRLYYQGPMFRHERPQKGRYRQFHQVGVEALGFDGPDIDAEHILMCARLWDDLGLEDVKLEINSLGSSEERAAHRAALITYLEAHKDSLDEDGQRRLYTNPLRILDTKNPDLQASSKRRPSSPTSSAKSRSSTSTACRPSSRTPACRTASTTAWCAASITTTARSSSGSRPASAPRARSVPAAVTTASSPSSAASRRRRRASRWASSVCSPCGRSPAARPNAWCPMSIWCTPARPPSGPLSASPKACAARALRSRCTVVAAASSRR